jgi:threonine/homoserine/homoserine lactone efflux protein
MLFGLIPGAIIAFIVNAFVVILGFVPGLTYLMTGSLQTGWTNALASVPGSTVASALSIGIALAAYKILDQALKLD